MLLKKAFEEGAFQFLNPADGSSLTVPDGFALAPIVGPALGRSSTVSTVTHVDIGEVENIVKPPRAARQPQIEVSNALGHVFLSISFADLPHPTIAREVFKRVFMEAGIRLVEGRAIGPGMITQLLDQIKATDTTILELSHLRPNIIVEMGLTLGLSHRLIPVLDLEAGSRPDLRLYPFLSDMGHIPYHLNEDEIRRLRSEVVSWYRKPLNDAHMLNRTLDNSTRLRVQQKPGVLAIYYPESRRSIWQNLIDGLRHAVSAAGYECIVVNQSPHKKRLPLLDNLVWAVSRCDRVLVDTSGREGPDLYGAFALGFAFALSRKGNSKQIKRVEEKGMEKQTGISMWPSQQYATWENPQTLLSIVSDFLPSRVHGRRVR
jgi:hypothetical protein